MSTFGVGKDGPRRTDVDHLVEAVGRRLRGPLAFDSGPDGPGPADDHPLASEVRALRAGESASLPWLTSEGYAWFTLAPSHEGLRRAVADLRAWIFPSLGWEDRRRPVVRPGEERGAIGARLIAVSPAGYVRWHTTHDGGKRVMDRLCQMRRLDARRPLHRSASRPGLFELRHRFQIALGVGDRSAAEAALKAIDAEQLDSAVNTGFMRLRLLTAFGDDARVVSDPGLPLLLQMRLPSRVRSAVIAAHHRCLLLLLEEVGDFGGAYDVYLEELDALLGAQLDAEASCPAGNEQSVVRLVAYRYAAKESATALTRMGEADPLDPVLRYLQSLGSSAQVGDGEIVTGAPEGEDRTATGIGDLPAAGTTGRPEGSASAAPQPPLSPDADDIAIEVAPLDWPDLLEAFQDRGWTEIDAFLSRHQDAIPGQDGDRVDGPPPSPEAVADTLLEIFATPHLPADLPTDQRIDRLVEVAVELSEPVRPRSAWRAVYSALLALLVERRCGYLVKQDGLLVLVLVGAVLAVDGTRGAREAVSAVQAWWSAMKVRTRLPWLLEALDLLSDAAVADGTPEAATATALWADGVELIRRDATGIMPGEIAHWRRLGARLDFDAPTLVEHLGPVDAPGDLEAPDPLRGLRANRVAIVTLLDRPAKAAREELAERINAEILVVCEHVACAATHAAKSADVILFAWGANTHAVYKEFDDVRDRLEYVAGRGASSIVIALERWASQQGT